MNYANIFRYWRTVLVVAEMSIRVEMVDAFVVFAIIFQPMIIAILGLFMLQDKGADFAMFVVVGSGLTGLWSSLLGVVLVQKPLTPGMVATRIRDVLDGTVSPVI